MICQSVVYSYSRLQRGLLAATMLLCLSISCNIAQKRESHYPDGNLMSRGYVKVDDRGNEVIHGSYVEWHEDGTKAKSGRFAMGKPNGKWTEWFPSGDKKAQYRYANGSLDGEYRTWHENGKLCSETHYRKGQKHGVETKWNSDGTKEWRFVFNRGAVLEYTMFDSRGEALEEFDIKTGFTNPHKKKRAED